MVVCHRLTVASELTKSKCHWEKGLNKFFTNASRPASKFLTAKGGIFFPRKKRHARMVATIKGLIALGFQWHRVKSLRPSSLTAVSSWSMRPDQATSRFIKTCRSSCFILEKPIGLLTWFHLENTKSSLAKNQHFLNMKNPEKRRHPSLSEIKKLHISKKILTLKVGMWVVLI